MIFKMKEFFKMVSVTEDMKLKLGTRNIKNSLVFGNKNNKLQLWSNPQTWGKR